MPIWIELEHKSFQPSWPDEPAWPHHAVWSCTPWCISQHAWKSPHASPDEPSGTRFFKTSITKVPEILCAWIQLTARACWSLLVRSAFCFFLRLSRDSGTAGSFLLAGGFGGRAESFLAGAFLFQAKENFFLRIRHARGSVNRAQSRSVVFNGNF